jgi:hypothetical protein
MKNKVEKISSVMGNNPITRRKALKYVLSGAAGIIGGTVAVGTAHAGYGQCSVSGCPCQAYAGSQQLCENCGHQYGMHW